MIGDYTKRLRGCIGTVGSELLRVFITGKDGCMWLCFVSGCHAVENSSGAF